MAGSNFAEEVRAVLEDTQNLPDAFLDYMVQHEAQHALSLQALIAGSFNSTGLGDAVKGSRYVGGTASGHPTTGYFKTGDFCVDQSGTMWVCITSGSPGTWKDVGASNLPVPGQILQSYYGLAPASDFTFTSSIFVSSNFPTNTTFTKLSDTSAMQMLMLCDFTAPSSAPDVLYCGVFVDGVNAQTTGVHTSVASQFVSVGNSGIWSTGRPTDPVLPSGAHTIAVKVATNSGSSTTLRSSTSVQLSITEFEP